MDIRTNVQETHYPIGYIRHGFEELWGWAEVVNYSRRSDPSVRWLRATYVEEFPEPVAVLAGGAIYLADEVRMFFDKHPRRTEVTPEMAEEIRTLNQGGMSKRAIAAMMELHVNTITKYLK